MRLRAYRADPISLDALLRSDAFTKTDAQTVEFRATLNPDQEKTLTYTAHYTW